MRDRLGRSPRRGRLAWVQMRATSGRIEVIDRAAPFWELRGSLLGKPRPDARDPATCAGLNCANPAAPAIDRECHGRGSGFLSLIRDVCVMMDACIHIGTGSVPGLAHAHGPPKCTSPHQCHLLVGAFLCPPGGEPAWPSESSRSAETSSMGHIVRSESSMRPPRARETHDAADNDLIAPLCPHIRRCDDCYNRVSKWLISNDFHPATDTLSPNMATYPPPPLAHVAKMRHACVVAS